MPVIFNENSYKFDFHGGRQHHFGRCYVSDFRKSYSILTNLRRYRKLRINDLPVYFPTTRAENLREHIIELWRSGMNIGIIKEGARSYSFSYIGDDEVPSLNDIRDIIMERRRHYPYTLFFLDIFNRHPEGLTESQIIPYFFSPNSNGIYNSGCLDQLHPTMNDLTRWNYIEGDVRRRISENGKIVLNSFNDRLVFICYNLDFGQDNMKIRLLWALSKVIQLNDKVKLPYYPFIQTKPPYIVDISKVFYLFNGKGRGKIQIIEKPSILYDLIRSLNINFDIMDVNNIKIYDKIFFSVTPAAYVNAGLSYMDGINNFSYTNLDNISVAQDSNFSNKVVEKINDRNNANDILPKYDYIMITYEPSSYNDLFSSFKSLILDYPSWLSFKDKIALNPPSTIIIGPNWSPAILEASCGHLMSYVKNGGILFIHGTQGGRTGTNKQFFNWLPPDFERLNFLSGSSKWTFDSNRLPDIPIKPIYCSSFIPNELKNEMFSSFYAKYGSGYFFFCGDMPSIDYYLENISKLKCNISNFEDTLEWKNRYLPQLYRFENITKEEHTYPILANILIDYFDFKMSESFSSGWKTGGHIEGYIDLFTTYPCITLWEVDSIRGKKGYTGGIAGDVVAIDQTHALKCEPYRLTAEKQFNILMNIILEYDTIDYNEMVLHLQSEINKFSKADNFQILEIFNTYLFYYRQSNSKFNSRSFFNFIRNSNNPINNKPVVSLIGASYGFSEGIKKSAREYSKDYQYSLWTYRDIFEILIRLEKYDKKTRQEKLLVLLNKRDGPVYFQISNI